MVDTCSLRHWQDTYALEDRYPTFRLMQDTLVGFMRDNGLLWEFVENRSKDTRLKSWAIVRAGEHEQMHGPIPFHSEQTQLANICAYIRRCFQKLKK